MRIYEFSKKHNIPSKDLIQELNRNGYEIKSHMSVLDQKAVDFLSKHFLKKTSNGGGMQKTVEIIKKRSRVRPVKKEATNEKRLPGNIDKEPDILSIKPMVLSTFCELSGKPVNEVIVSLLRMGIVATKNQVLAVETVEALARSLNLPIERPLKEKQSELKKISVDEGIFKGRPPVVVVLGHVDHGKTTLLDFIRKARVAEREKGGITQHLGAYEVSTADGNIIFIDTPGHEAFSKIRGRSAGVADIAVLIIAADDGVMPQTIEAIKHIKAADIPVIVALNKADRVNAARIEAVRSSLAQYNLLPEEWGGDVIVVPISAKSGQGVDELLEMIALKAQMMELTADVAGPAKGYILEARPEKGRGAVGTVLCHHGKLKLGDFFVCGQTGGKASSLVDSFGARVKEVGASVPVQVAGFEQLPEAGDLFEVVSLEEFKNAQRYFGKERSVQQAVVDGALNLLIKADTNSSLEALLDSIAKLSLKISKEFNIIYSGVGDISESDVMLALNTQSIIYAFNAKVEHNAQGIAQRHGVQVESYDIIYKLLEGLEELVEKGKEVEKVVTKIGEAVVRKVFDIKGVGVIAGCYVRDGRINNKGELIVMRGKQKIGSGSIASLQRERRVVKEVHAGFECGIMIAGYTDWDIDDRIECYLEVPATEKK